MVGGRPSPGVVVAMVVLGSSCGRAWYPALSSHSRGNGGGVELRADRRRMTVLRTVDLAPQQRTRVRVHVCAHTHTQDDEDFRADEAEDDDEEIEDEGEEIEAEVRLCVCGL